MKQVAAKTLRPKRLVIQDTADTVERRVKSERVNRVQEFRTLPEQVAKSTVCFKNFYPAELRETYRYFDRMKRIDLCFPYARLADDEQTTMLLVDTPETEQDVEVCYQKKPILDAAGYKYAVIEKDSNLYDVLQQLKVI